MIQTIITAFRLRDIQPGGLLRCRAYKNRRPLQLPHLILRGEGKFQGVLDLFEPFTANMNGWILKLRACYLSSEGNRLLFECTAVRSGFSQDFYLRADQKEECITIRLDPYMRVERNEGVQRCILLAANSLLARQPALEFEKSNLPPEVLQSFAGVLPR